MPFAAGDSGVISTGGGCPAHQDKAEEDLDDRLGRTQAHLPVQRSGGPPSRREDHAVHGHHQQHVCQGSQVRLCSSLREVDISCLLRRKLSIILSLMGD